MQQPEPQPRSYESLLNDIVKGLVKIPQFQRDFVWPREKSAALIDSILRGYPIGTFIFWRTCERLRSVRNITSIAARRGSLTYACRHDPLAHPCR